MMLFTQMQTALSRLALIFSFIILLPACSGFNASDDTADTDVNYQIMVQRATQTAIWAMPAVGLIDLKKATIRDLGGTINEVVYLTRPFDSRHGLIKPGSRVTSS